MTDVDRFDVDFQNLTDRRPFPWQRALYQKIVAGDIPETCDLPTGLGKTSIIAIWLIALARNPDAIPRRLVYVVNRRTVVDQTTTEVKKLRDNLVKTDLESQFKALCSVHLGKDDPLLAISTLRGQFADNREWAADPSRPGVIIGTVDMIGSRLLFSGYGLGFRSKPLHAGFLGQDVLLVHDEAHLEPAFHACLDAIKTEQKKAAEFRAFRVIELSATPRSSERPFQLTEEERNPPSTFPNDSTEPLHIVWQRQCASKTINLHECADEKKLAEEIAELALEYKDSKCAIVVFVRRVDDVGKIVALLEAAKQKVQPLTGTQRGLERDELVEGPVFQRFLPDGKSSDETVYLVCTSAGEVGVNISADHLICDLTTFDSMTQRFGRVNRFGENPDSAIHIVHPKEIPPTDEFARRREKTLALLIALNRNGSPRSIAELDPVSRRDAFAPDPEMLPATEILFDSWALTSVTNQLPGRPPVEPYLHGKEDDEAAQTQFAWREEVELTTGMVSEAELEELLDLVPPKPHELLRVSTFGKGRAYDQLQKIAIRTLDLPVWIIEPDGSLITNKTVSEVVEKRGANYVIPLQSRTVVLPPKAGGLTTKGTLDGNAPYSSAIRYDVYGLISENSLWRFKVTDDAEGRPWSSPVSTISDFEHEQPIELTDSRKCDRGISLAFRQLGIPVSRTKLCLNLVRDQDEETTHSRVVAYLIVQQVPSKKGLTGTPEWPALERHLEGVRQFARRICDSLRLPESLALPIELAAAWHDLGKGRPVWQRGAGNLRTSVPVSKPIHGRPPEKLNHYRHELGSLIDLHGGAEFTEQLTTLTDEQRDIVLHLIAAHHGRARPHFPKAEVIDLDSSASILRYVCDEVPDRFARLQRQFGRWGLAYLESILRAADALDSKRIDSTPVSDPAPGEWQPPRTSQLEAPTKPNQQPAFQVNVDLRNPGQFLACCGLLELADRKWPGAMGWFESTRFCVQAPGDLKQLLDAFAGCVLTNTMTASEHARSEELRKKSTNERKKDKALEDEYKNLEKRIREDPLVLESPFHLRLDWFIDEYADGSRFKTWAGQQSVLRIAESMKNSLKDDCWRDDNCLRYSVSGCGLPFNFDSDLGSQGGAIDVGFSFDPLAGSALTRIESTARPVLELLAFIGLQRFRPSPNENENRFLYSAWSRPLPVSIASAAACGALPTPGAEQFEFRLLYRTKYLKSFLPAVPFYGDSDE